MHAPIEIRRDAETFPQPPLTRSEISVLSSLVAARRERNRRFANGAKLFCDPAWDIMIDLLDAGMRGRSVSITGACGASGVPSTTALRYVGLLEQEDLIERASDEHDGRRVFLSLTARGWAEMRAYAAWMAKVDTEADERSGTIGDASGGRGRIPIAPSAGIDG